ncbi:N-methyl-L-tryptophan oxidase [Gordonia sp. NPDC003425]
MNPSSERPRRSVIVIGLGSIGSMALWQLAKRGIDVLGIEQFGRIHTEGAYAGESRLFRVAAKEGELFTPALLRSRELWQELGDAYGRDILLPAGALSVAPADHPDLRPTLASINAFDLPHEVLDAAEMRKRFPQFHIEENDIGVLDSLGGAMRPEMAVAAATDQAMVHGASALYDTEVLDVAATSDGVRVTTTRGEFIADRVVVTAGPWTARLLPDLAGIVQAKTFALTWLMPRHVERFTADIFPGFMRDLHDVHAFGVPTLDGYSIKICPHLDLDAFDDWEDRPTSLTREQLRWVGEQAQRMIPDLIGEVVRWSLHSDSWTPTKLPVIDTADDGIIVATAMSGNGFKFAPVWGEALADLASTGSASLLDDAFTVESHRAATVTV